MNIFAELLLYIFSYLDGEDIVNFSYTSITNWKISNEQVCKLPNLVGLTNKIIRDVKHYSYLFSRYYFTRSTLC